MYNSAKLNNLISAFLFFPPQKKFLKCNKRHEFVCPEIEKNKICLTKNCIYCKAKWQKDSKDSKIEQKLENTKTNIATKHVNLLSASNSTESKENGSCKRYFIESCNNRIKCTETCEKANIDEINCNAKECNTENTTEIESTRRNRPKLGVLPAYIPL